MDVVIITGSGGLIGSEAAEYFAGLGYTVVGVDNDMRRVFFGDEASTAWNLARLQRRLDGSYLHVNADIRDADAIEQVFARHKGNIAAVIHTAAQPSHDWAARDPFTDFGVNAVGTLNLLEMTRRYAIDASFIFTSTNKVYGDLPNRLPLIELEQRWEIDPSHAYADGIAEDMSIDQSTHSLFGASKAGADLLVQEYGRYFGMKTVCLRGGCLTGPNHSGTALHGFLAYLMKCTVTGAPYEIYGYKGKQVRDNIHSADFVRLLGEFVKAPRSAEVYNIGGGRDSNCSMLEAIEQCEEIAGRKLNWTYKESNRIGDHIWYVSDLAKLKAHYPAWGIERGIRDILTEIHDVNAERWSDGVAS